MTPTGAQGDSPTILLVDDDATSLDVLKRTLDGRGFRLLATRNGHDALRAARRARPLVVLLDVMMPGMDGYETCAQLKADPETAAAAVIFLSALDETRDKVRGLEVGAVDFVTKPFQGEEVVARVNAHVTIQRLQRELEARNAALARELAVAQELITDARRRVEGPLLGSSPAIRALRESIAHYAATDEPLLLIGIQGAGHETVARAIHHSSSRRQRAFIHVNCQLLPPGEDPGLFSASNASGKLSLWELADGGTLYVDGVQRLPLPLQERLADVLASVEARSTHDDRPAPDVRLIAFCSTELSPSSGLHPRLLRALEARQLRVPSLPERAEDIPGLAQFFISQHARRLGSVVEGVSQESLRRLQRYHWPGGVYELRSLLERAVISARGRLIEIEEGLLDEGLPLGSYRLVEKIGEGGMGEVWRARHHLLARPCAVKLIRPGLLGEAQREQTLERFRREARTIARLSSPNTVRVYDFGLSDTGSPYLVMELLDGMDLFSVVERHGPLPPGRVASVLQQASRSLAEAHTSGLLHRDIKPQNLFLCRLGVDVDVVKVLDFGLARSFRDDEEQITIQGVLTGTPAYMPPERALGHPADERSDLYSLGCTAYFMLTGRPVFSGEPMAVMLQHIRSKPKPPSSLSSQGVPEGLDRLVLACLEKVPEARPASAIELWARLAELRLEGEWSREQAERWWSENRPSVEVAGQSELTSKFD